LDRFSIGVRDAQNVKAVEMCVDCEGEIYEGDIAYCCMADLLCEKCFYKMLKIIEEECKVYVYK